MLTKYLNSFRVYRKAKIYVSKTILKFMNNLQVKNNSVDKFFEALVNNY